MASTRTYLITGASRSLGLGYARALLASSPSTRVVAAARNPDKADALQALAKEEANKGRMYLLKLDMDDVASVENAAKELEGSGFLGEGGVDALVLNAGVCIARMKTPTQTTEQDVMDNLKTNLFGTMQVVSTFLTFVRKSKAKQIIGVSSVCGSITKFGELTLNTPYGISKVALNMYLKKLATELKEEGFTVCMFHPGYVKTDINDGAGDIMTEEAVDLAMKNVFLKVSPQDNGAFLSYDGTAMPW
ncbi:hypothetical protein JCM8547_006662 [Rhodosporidiobolus lusitaniae]